MTTTNWRHGAYISDNLASPLPKLSPLMTNVVFMSGTAPTADPLVFPYDTPVLIAGAAGYNLLSSLGTTGSLPAAVANFFQQGDESELLGSYLYICRGLVGASDAQTLTNLIGSPSARTGIYAATKLGFQSNRMPQPTMFCAPGWTGVLTTNGVVAIDMTNQGGSYSAQTTMTAAGGGLTGCQLTPIINTEGQITGAQVNKPGYGCVTPAQCTVTITDPAGAGANATATATIGVVGNPLAIEMGVLCAQLKGQGIGAVAYVDGPNTTDADAIMAASAYASNRIYICDPQVSVWSTSISAYVPLPSSGAFAGVQCWSDQSVGVHCSVSNWPINGIDGTVRVVGYGAETNLLGAAYVGTITNLNDGRGLVTWGNRATDGSFLCQTRARDVVDYQLATIAKPTVDRPLNRADIVFLMEDLANELDAFETKGTVLPGWSITPSATLNTATTMANGQFYADVLFENPPPMEDIELTSYPNPVSYTLLLQSVMTAITSSTVGDVSAAA